MTLSIALIGCGHIAKGHHGPALQAHAAASPDLRLAACCDTDADRASAFAERFGFARSYTDWREMLAAEKVDAVVLLVPPAYTAALSADIMASGCRYLLIEKPPGLNADEAWEIDRAARLHGSRVMVAFNRRHMPVVRELRERLAQTPAGDLHHIRYEMIRHHRPDADFSTTAIHGLDVVRRVAGADYERLTFAYQELPGVGEGVANFAAHGAFTSGTTVDLQFFPVSGLNLERLTVHVRDRMYVAELPFVSSLGGYGRLTVYERGAVLDSWEAEPRPGDGNGFYEEIGAFFDCVRTGQAPEDDVPSTVQSVEVSACIRARAQRYEAGSPDSDRAL